LCRSADIATAAVATGIIAAMRVPLFTGVVFVGVLAAAPAAQKVVKQSISFQNKTRNYYLLVPEPAPTVPPPLIVLLHGSGRDGSSLTNPWQNLAKKSGFAIVAPDAIDRSGWDMFSDGPDFLHDVIEAVKNQARVDPRRVYLFGHSAGGHHGLGVGLLESEYFAAVAVHAGILSEVTLSYTARAKRKVPFALWQGSNDPVVPAAQARISQGALKARGFPADLIEIKGHTHDYYGRSNEINSGVWAFLEKHRLEAEPVFEKHHFVR
jgi:poly(3-hydroxybutyrate) depolymerase